MRQLADCDDVLRQLWDFLDGAVTSADRELIEAHLRRCGDCLPTYEMAGEFLASLRAAMRAPGQRTELRERVLAMVRQADADRKASG